MSKPNNYGPSFDMEDAVAGFLDAAAKLCFYVGMLAVATAVGFLGFYFFHFAGMSNPSSEATALNNIGIFEKVIVAGSIAGAIGSCYLFWGEELLHGIQLLLAAALIFCPYYLPAITAAARNSEVGVSALEQIQKGGMVLGAIAVIALVVELGFRVRSRAVQGAKLDSMRYGKDIKSEKYQNKFMGKCWQLPFCRKFVREKCPIYHSRRTCWRERVGCMCEEEVIQNAMENRAIPKDAVAAARYIPVNNKLSMAQKRERCRQCVIYNEHLKHKYKLALPVTIGSFALLYVAGRSPLLNFTEDLINRLNGILARMTDSSAPVVSAGGMGVFREIFLDCFMFVLLAYVLKLLEYFIFKLKV